MATTLNHLAALLQAQGKYPEAEPLVRRALGIHEASLGPDHPIVANTLNTTTPDYLGVSPVDPHAATAHILRKEFMEVMNVSGAAGFLEEVVPTGPPPEGDKSRGVAISADGTTAVMIHTSSCAGSVSGSSRSSPSFRTR